MNRNKRVLIVEPSAIVTEGLVQILQESPEFELLEPLDDMENLKERLDELKPEILIINPSIMHYSKHAAASAVFQDYPQIAVVALVYQYIESSVLRNFHAVLEVREARGRIADVLHDALAALEMHRQAIDSNSSELTKREVDVLVLVAKGLMSKEIADKLNISIHTVITHRKNITRKTNIKSVAGLAMYALMNNLIEEGVVL